MKQRLQSIRECGKNNEQGRMVSEGSKGRPDHPFCEVSALPDRAQMHYLTDFAFRATFPSSRITTSVSSRLISARKRM